MQLSEILVQLLTELTNIKDQLHEIDKKQAIHNEILEEHQRRSTQLEERMKPVEDHVKFIHGFMKYTTGIATFVGTVVAIYLSVK